MLNSYIMLIVYEKNKEKKKKNLPKKKIMIKRRFDSI